MSTGWLVPQYCIAGLAKAINAIGQIEFYYSQLPKNMGSFAMALLTLGMSLGYLVGAFIVQVVNGVSVKYGRVEWLSKDPNKGR